MDDNSMKIKESYDLGTFEFLKTGWWIWHVVVIAAVFYIGYLFGGNMF